MELRIPPLRERREEIPHLAAWFLAKFNAQYGRQKQLSPETLARLAGYSWSGNVRRMVVLTDGEQVFEAQVARERTALREVLERVRGNRAEMSQILKVSYKTLLNKIAGCGLKGGSIR